jgi:hypothetical protein
MAVMVPLVARPLDPSGCGHLPTYSYDGRVTNAPGVASQVTRTATLRLASGMRSTAVDPAEPSPDVSVVAAEASAVAAEGAEAASEVGSGQVTVLGRYIGGTDAYVGKEGFNVLDLPSKEDGPLVLEPEQGLH